MTLAWVFIGLCWVGAVALWVWLAKRDRTDGLTIIGCVFVVVIMIGSLWVPDLWLPSSHSH